MAWTYFSPELTLKEMKLVEDKDEKYMQSFKMFMNADVDETEMRLSSSSSKYLIAYCRRKTIAIDSRNFPDENQESDSLPSLESLPSQDDFIDTSETDRLLVQEKPAEKTSVRCRLMLLFMILVLVSGVTVGLSIYFTITREKEAVLILSNFIRGSNLLVPMVIDLGATSTGKFHFYIIS